LTKPVADALAKSWQQLGSHDVSVILDVDPEVCRLGYGTLEGLETIQGTASLMGESVCHQPGIRICILVADDDTLVFSPTPQLVEAGSTHPRHPNAVRVGSTPPQIELDLGITNERESTRTIGLDPVRPAKVEAVKADLKDNPPVKFDLARKVRVFNAQLEFVEFELHGCFVSRKTAAISPDLMGLADDEATKERLRSTFRVLSETDMVDDEGDKKEASSTGSKVAEKKKKMLSEKTLKDERKRIADTYLRSLQGFGTVILRSNKHAFEREVTQLQALVTEFQTKLKAKLSKIIDDNANKLTDALLPSVERRPPTRWTGSLGLHSSKDDRRKLLLREVKEAFGTPESIVKEMGVSVVFKGVTYETLTESRFAKLAQEHFPTLRLHEEYDAARASTK
jgi:hypothetical protein